MPLMYLLLSTFSTYINHVLGAGNTIAIWPYLMVPHTVCMIAVKKREKNNLVETYADVADLTTTKRHLPQVHRSFLCLVQ